MDTPVFTVRGQHTEEEFIRFYRFVALRSKKVRWTYGILFGVCLLWLLCGIYGNLFLDMPAIHILLPIAVGVWYVWALTGGLNRKAAKLYHGSKLSEDIEYDMSFFEDHFDAVDPYGNSSVPFDRMHGIWETPTNFYLMTAPASGVVLRKEDLPEGAAEFLRGVKEKYKL